MKIMRVYILLALLIFISCEADLTPKEGCVLCENTSDFRTLCLDEDYQNDFERWESAIESLVEIGYDCDDGDGCKKCYSVTYSNEAIVKTGGNTSWPEVSREYLGDYCGEQAVSNLKVIEMPLRIDTIEICPDVFALYQILTICTY